MDKVIALGPSSCKIADQLAEHPEYRIYKITTDVGERGTLVVDNHADMETYETSFDMAEYDVYLRSIKSGDEVVIIVTGGDPLNGVLLKMMERIKDARLNILYIIPDLFMLSQIEHRDNRITFGVLQEYARSGVLDKMMLVQRSVVESLVGDVPIQEYEKSINHLISYVFAMINYFNHTDAVLESTVAPPEWSRIMSLGLSSLEDNHQDVSLLCPLEGKTHLHLLYGIPSDQLDEDVGLIKKIKTHVKYHTNDDTHSSFAVYSTSFEDRMVLCVAHTANLQPLPPVL